MAKKSRTPPPPRRAVQAPKRRESARPASEAERRQRFLLYVLGGSGLVMLVAVVLFLALASRGGSADESDLAATMRAAGCTFQTFEDQGRDHVGDLDAEVEYNSNPPTSGRHYFLPAIWDFYDRPVNQVQSVHNLEHGGMVIQFGDAVPAEAVEQLREYYRDDPNGMLVAPLPELGDKIAMTAWTHLATCTRFDEDAFSAFRDTYRGRGPERFDLEALRPGGT